MTNAKHPGDETDRTLEIDVRDAMALKQELYAAWAAVHPEGTRQQFDDEWVAVTNTTRPSDTTSGHAPASEDQDPLVIKRRMFEEWIAARPGATNAQFEAEWEAVTALRGV